MFKFVKKSEAEKNDELRKLRNEKAKLEADLAYVAMMTDVEIDEVMDDEQEQEV